MHVWHVAFYCAPDSVVVVRTCSISDDDIEELTVPTGTPLIYSLDADTLEPVKRRVLGADDAEKSLLADQRESGFGGRAPGQGHSQIEESDIVSTTFISDEDKDLHEARLIDGVAWKPITICNKSWRVLSGPGVTEDLDVAAEHRRVGEEVNLGAGMVYMSEELLNSISGASKKRTTK